MTSVPIDDETPTESGCTRRGSARFLAAVAFAAISLLAVPAWGHVAFDSLEPGTRFLASSVVELTWVDTIHHETTAYHLEFLPGAEAAAIPIAADIPPTQHSWSWQVPAEACSDCSLHIIQDNVDSDYSATLPITIVTDASDLTVGGNPADPREATGMHLPPDMAGSGGTSPSPTEGAGGMSPSQVPAPAGASEQAAGCSLGTTQRWIPTRSPLLLGWLLAGAVCWVRRHQSKRLVRWLR